ncbi:hypothetical protein N7460_012615 [Penicillium canescens]|uniref:Uncharacterized protein n=1 Tax=Penicillium canescens TaxID=5083 RepID=A0AAD6I3Q9_PENCN|nr:hypothetical protein N7460_012615 [Penicillium canescens]
MKSLRPLSRVLQTNPLTTIHPVNIHTKQPTPTSIPLQSQKLSKTEEILLERCILNPQRAETCQSGTDDEVEHLALEEEYRLEGDSLHDPLSVSPANREVSMILDPMVGVGVVQGVPHLRSVQGWTRKGKEVLIKRSPFEVRRYEDVFFGRRKGVEKKG